MGEGMDAPAARALPPSGPVCCSRASPVVSRFQASGGSVGISVQEMSAKEVGGLIDFNVAIM